MTCNIYKVDTDFDPYDVNEQRGVVRHERLLELLLLYEFHLWNSIPAWPSRLSTRSDDFAHEPECIACWVLEKRHPKIMALHPGNQVWFLDKANSAR